MEDLATAHEDKNPDWYELGIKKIRWIYSIMRKGETYPLKMES